MKSLDPDCYRLEPAQHFPYCCFERASDPYHRILELLKSIPYSTCLVFIDPAVTCVHCPSELVKTNHLSIRELSVTEQSKDASCLLRFLAKYQPLVNCDALLVAIGGGAFIDFVGFASSIMFRGVRYLTVPTSLMSMADSAFGGKTGVNFAAKNQIGTYHHPLAVYVNPIFLRSLPHEHLLSGLMEIVKLSFFSPDLQQLLEQIDPLTLETDRSQLDELVFTSAELKRELIQSDPFERDNATICLYGHCFGNSFEVHCWEDSGEYIPHGFAVALGMLFSAYITEQVDRTKSGYYAQHWHTLSRFISLPPLIRRRIPETGRELAGLLARDKYCLNGQVQVPALGLKAGFDALPLEQVVEIYDCWKEESSS